MGGGGWGGGGCTYACWQSSDMHLLDFVTTAWLLQPPRHLRDPLKKIKILQKANWSTTLFLSAKKEIISDQKIIVLFLPLITTQEGMFYGQDHAISTAALGSLFWAWSKLYFIHGFIHREAGGPAAWNPAQKACPSLPPHP
jgi:hypothetical protein